MKIISETTLLFLLLISSLSVATSYGQIKYADVVLDAFYSGANPEFSSFYGNNPVIHGCNLFELNPEVALGDNDTIVALPTGSYITLGFEDNLVFDAPGQDDLFIEEIGGGQEFGDLFVSPDGVNFFYLDTINGAKINSFDLADYPYDDVVKAVRIIGLNSGGCIPGLDIARVFGVDGSNCFCGALLMDFPYSLCTSFDTLINLNALVMDESAGVWRGLGVMDSTFNPLGLEGQVELNYIVNFDHLICPADTVPYIINLGLCDCNNVIGGDSVLDDCGMCLEQSDPDFNFSCQDCAGVPNGPAMIDVCGVCLDTTDVLFDQTCFDCNGVEGGTAILDICDNCLPANDPEFNLNCPERFRVYVPTIFDMNSARERNFGLFASEDNLLFLESFEIYDRWGSIVFEIGDQPLNAVTQWWDGRKADQELNPGVYTVKYHLSYPMELGFPDELIVVNVVMIK